jgi:NADH/NAD ratio-sensing transcriptional regulator Rex
MIAEAILKIKSDAEVTVNGNDIDTCEIIWHDNNPTNITKEQIKVAIQEIEDAEAQKIADKEAANAKLRALGLTDDEIEAFKS